MNPIYHSVAKQLCDKANKLTKLLLGGLDTKQERTVSDELIATIELFHKHYNSYYKAKIDESLKILKDMYKYERINNHNIKQKIRNSVIDKLVEVYADIFTPLILFNKCCNYDRASEMSFSKSSLERLYKLEQKILMNIYDYEKRTKPVALMKKFKIYDEVIKKLELEHPEIFKKYPINIFKQ